MGWAAGWFSHLIEIKEKEGLKGLLYFLHDTAKTQLDNVKQAMVKRLRDKPLVEEDSDDDEEKAGCTLMKYTHIERITKICGNL